MRSQLLAVKHYQECSRCVMDSSAIEIEFDDNGFCNYCANFIKDLSKTLFQDGNEGASQRQQFVAKVKAAGRGKNYDCVVGVSGGVDSSWALYLCVKEGLRPLAVHMDNGWDSELAQQNIENLVTKLGVDLHTHVIDWDEYRDLQQAFFDADVIDVELLYDNAMLAVNYQMAAKHSVKYILAGTNQSTEGMAMPPTWNWFKYDKKNIYSIWKKFGNGKKIDTFPAIGSWNYVMFRKIRGIEWFSFLDYFNYEKATAMDFLNRELGYKPYPYKHYESIFTRFYQGYLLPKKFGVDKRRLHLSTLVISGQMNRDQAIKMLEQSPYPSQDDLEQDIEYFLKKMRWPKSKLEDYLARPGKPHDNYGSEKKLWEKLMKVSSYLKRLT